MTMCKNSSFRNIILCIILLFSLVCCVCIGVGFAFKYKKVDMVYVNEVVQCLNQGTVPKEIVYDYVLADKTGEVIASTIDTINMDFETRLSKAYAAGDIVVDFDQNSKLIFFVKSSENFYQMRNSLIWMIIGACVLMAAAICVAFVLVYNRTVKPFGKLKDFAGEVAKGNLDSPLLLDKYMTFGAFGEAFDIMRNNLREARLAEQTASLERTRLLQEIGHEIKTPLSTIRAVAECGYVASQNKNYSVILGKVTAIDNLINDFYQKALEEEGQLNVYITKHPMQELKAIIEKCDYNQRVVFGNMPNCNVLFDKNRFLQIVDNIIANSYKYADTDIKVDFSVVDKKAEIIFKDFGEGVEEEQLSYIMDRFYRGSRTEEKVGQGLGLNISRKLIMRMGGEMECYNDNGFVVKLKLQVFDYNDKV